MQGVPCRSSMWSVRATKSGAKWRILRLEMRPALRSPRLCVLAVGLKDFFAQRRRTFRLARFSNVLPCVTTCVHIVGNDPHWTAPEQIKTGQLHTISLNISYYLPWMTDSDLQDLDRCSSHDPLCTRRMAGLDDALSPSAGFSELQPVLREHELECCVLNDMFMWVRTKLTLTNLLIKSY